MRSRGHAARNGRGGGEADGPRFFPLNDQLSERRVGELFLVHGSRPGDDGLDGVRGEEGTVQRAVIDGDDPVACEIEDAGGEGGHRVVGPGVVVVDFAYGIGRVEKPAGVGAVVVGEESLVGEVFDADFVEAGREGAEVCEDVLTGGLALLGDGVGGAAAAKAEAVAQQVAGGALEACEAGLLDQRGEVGTAGEGELNLAQEWLQMELSVSIEVDQAAVEVVHDFGRGWRLGEEDGQAAAECLDVELVGPDEWEDGGEEPGFATRPAEDRFKCHAPTDAEESHSIHHNAHKVGHFACGWLFVVLEWVTTFRQNPPFSGSIRVA